MNAYFLVTMNINLHGVLAELHELKYVIRHHGDATTNTETEALWDEVNLPMIT